MAAALERRKIATVAIQLLEEIAVRVRPPRSLLVPFPLGYPLGRPGDGALQHEVLEAALRMVEDAGLGPPALSRFG